MCIPEQKSTPSDGLKQLDLTVEIAYRELVPKYLFRTVSLDIFLIEFEEEFWGLISYSLLVYFYFNCLDISKSPSIMIETYYGTSVYLCTYSCLCIWWIDDIFVSFFIYE